MKLPGFTAEASLSRSASSYLSKGSFGSTTNKPNTISMQINFPPWWPGPMPTTPPYSPTGGWPGPPLPPSPGWTYPPGWTPPYPGWTPPPGWPPPPVVGGGAIAGGAGAAGGISLWWLIPGAIAGTIIGGAAGLGTEWLLTPETPTTTLPPSCRTTSTPPVTGTITGCYWGCERSLSKTINDAEEFCGKLTNYCTGTCPNGSPCKPTAAAIPRSGQGWCWAGCETTVDFTCICGC